MLLTIVIKSNRKGGRCGTAQQNSTDAAGGASVPLLA
jgi:hypothetical protein